MKSNAAYQGFRQSLRSLDLALDAARQATKVATERYDRGLTDFLNVLDAERQQFALEQQRAEVVRLAGDSFVALYKALGGGWPPERNHSAGQASGSGGRGGHQASRAGSAASAAASAAARADPLTADEGSMPLTNDPDRTQTILLVEDETEHGEPRSKLNWNG